MREWAAYLGGLGRAHELLLVDDATVDRTAELATAHPEARVLRDAERRGVGAALRLGVEQARHPLLFYTTADRRYPPADLERLLAEIDKVQIVSGHRVGRPPPGWVRGVGVVYRGLARLLFGMPLEPLPGWLGWRAHASNWVVRALFGLRCHDPACAFRLVRREVFRRAVIESRGPFAQVELLAKANFLGAVMTEVPVVPRPDALPEPDETPGQRRQYRRELWHVFAQPSFGPVVLPEDNSAKEDQGTNRADSPSASV